MTTPWWQQPVPAPDDAAARRARLRQDELTKPRGALGCLEDLAARLAALQGTDRPTLARPRITVFVADHGVAAEGVSAYPQAVTLEMARNLGRGGAAISVLARELGAGLEVVDVGTAADAGALDGIVPARVAAGTRNLALEPAMTAAQSDAALAAGQAAVHRAVEHGADAFIGGDMGIANTTAAAALACSLLGTAPHALAGPGSGLDAAGVDHKAAVIARALERHGAPTGAFAALAALGGLEIAALAGACIACAQQRLPMLVDGFIAGVAALAAARQVPAVAPWLIVTHRSAEPGHDRVLAGLGQRPILDLGMRLGEGTGAAAAVPVVRAACALHAGMATFAEAGVSRPPDSPRR